MKNARMIRKQKGVRVCMGHAQHLGHCLFYCG